MEQKANQYLETEPVGVLMRKYSISCIISLPVAALYNIVDQIFIANADYLGSYGNAANTVVFPLTVVALAGVVFNILFDPIRACTELYAHGRSLPASLSSFLSSRLSVPLLGRSLQRKQNQRVRKTHENFIFVQNEFKFKP